MNKEEILSLWAPEGARWSRWAKPVSFAYLDTAFLQTQLLETAAEVSWAPSPDGSVALVLDMPGAEGVLAGVALASRGYRPVPLYNAVPLPFTSIVLDPATGRSVAAVNVLPILSGLKSGAEQLARLSLPADAPPAFLLDANRAGGGRQMQEDEFDNRSVSFTTDFPSALFLAAHGIQRVLLVQKDRLEPQPDLAHTLRRWQDGGIKLERLWLETPAPPEPFTVPKPSWYGAMFQRVLAGLGFRRAWGGGFGAWVPSSSSGG